MQYLRRGDGAVSTGTAFGDLTDSAVSATSTRAGGCRLARDRGARHLARARRVAHDFRRAFADAGVREEQTAGPRGVHAVRAVQSAYSVMSLCVYVRSVLGAGRADVRCVPPCGRTLRVQRCYDRAWPWWCRRCRRRGDAVDAGGAHNCVLRGARRHATLRRREPTRSSFAVGRMHRASGAIGVSLARAGRMCSRSRRLRHSRQWRRGAAQPPPAAAATRPR